MTVPNASGIRGLQPFIAAACLAACGGDERPSHAAGLPAATAGPAVACGPASGDVRACTFTVPGGRVRATDSAGFLTALATWQNGVWRPLPRFSDAERPWSRCSLVVQDSGFVPRPDHVAVADADGDGRPDLAVVAGCATGMGPDGARPYPVGVVYTRRAGDRYGRDEARDRAFTTALPERCAEYACDVLGAVRQLRQASPSRRGAW